MTTGNRVVTRFKSKPWRSERYRQWIRSLPCLICGTQPAGHAHHEQQEGNGVMGDKCGDDRCLPLCWHHHRNRHDKGRSFWGGADIEAVIFRIKSVSGFFSEVPS